MNDHTLTPSNITAIAHEYSDIPELLARPPCRRCGILMDVLAGIGFMALLLVLALLLSAIAA